MKWNKYTIKTTTKATEYISGILIGLGITGLEIKDNLQISDEDKKAMYIDYLPVLPDNDETAYITFYTEDADNEKDSNADSYNLTGVELNKQKLEVSDGKLLENIRNEILQASAFLDVGEGSITKEITQDTDWINNWKNFFKPFKIGKFYIKPVWDNEGLENDNWKVINIDPGIAFGTGKHETTRLCIEELEKYVKEGDAVFDCGCGSAILSVVSKKLGAGRMLLTDIDPAAINSAPGNLHINDVYNPDITIKKGNILEDEELKSFVINEKYDIVVANILADVIIPLIADVHNYMNKDGIFISSGIIYTRASEVTEAIKANENLQLLDVKKQGDWVMVSAARVK